MKLLLILTCSLLFSATSEFDVGGMICGGGCVKKINRALDSIDGIKSREVNFEKKTMIVQYDDKLVTDKMIIEALKKNNYSCNIKKDEEKPKGFFQKILSWF